jgi:ABC-type multidrug transport system fused ATPase/permease subunit
MSYSSHRKGLFAIGFMACIGNGVIFPIFSIFLAKMLAILINFKDDPIQARKDANTYALIYFLLGIAAFIVNLIQQTIFTTIGEEMTEKIRNETYLKILKMPIVWLDMPRNSGGALSARLASDCQTVNGLTTTYISILIQNLANLVAGITIALIYEWRTALVAVGLIPFMIIAGAIQMAFTTGFSAKTDVAYKDSSSLITESMVNIRTVTSFGYENMILDKYSNKLKEPYEIGVKKGNISGILFGFSQLIMYVVFALIFYLGAVFIRDNNLSIADVFTAIYSIMFAGMTAGNNSHFMPDVATAKNSAANIFEILDGEDEDQLQIKDGSKLLKTPIRGHIEFKNVTFKYETRNEHVF